MLCEALILHVGISIGILLKDTKPLHVTFIAGNSIIILALLQLLGFHAYINYYGTSTFEYLMFKKKVANQKKDLKLKKISQLEYDLWYS